ncbi:MAG: DNA repair protein RecO [Gammaproteobacteria bacterium]|nr:DNA repair protein RecO [Gammaproteobacteria bacterium]MDH5730071.1 DNA repair protein RecO [Gammaproteobacteria bacterium]
MGSPTSQVELQPAYILHNHAYAESSVLLDVFTRDFGRVSLIAKGAKRPRSSFRGILQAFQPLLISWRGKGQVHTLVHAEIDSSLNTLPAKTMMSAFYLNELVMRLCHQGEAMDTVFSRYGDSILALSNPDVAIEAILRSFEKVLISELGYQLVLHNDAESGEVIQSQNYYRYVPDKGPVQVSSDSVQGLVITGESLLALQSDSYDNPRCLKDIKRLMRFVLTPLLGHKPLRSRELYRALQRN